MTTYKVDWSSSEPSQGVPGKEPINLPEKTTNSTSTSLVLTGKKLPNYGEIQQENFIRLLENFASRNPPPNPTIGQLWYNSEQNILYMRIDPVLFGHLQPLYFPQSPAAWAQIWPQSTRNAFASLAEYSSLALTINRIIGVPTQDSSAANDQFGWGQTDLVPEYDDNFQLKAGFSPITYPPVFSNEAWVILLSRLRKALRHVGGNEGAVSPVGFIDDGRPPPPDGSALANAYNDNPVATSLPDYKAGWNNNGHVTLNLFYGNTINVINELIIKRFRRPVASTQSQFFLPTGVSPDITGSSFERVTTWDSTKNHELRLVFETENDAKAYFNSGGQLRFEWTHSNTSNAFNQSWNTFMLSTTGLRFKYDKLYDKNDVVSYRDADVTPDAAGETLTYGFYNLPDTTTLIWQRRRVTSAYYAYVADGGIEIFARRFPNTSTGKYEIHFDIVYRENAGAGEIAQAGTQSAIHFDFAHSRNVNSPIIALPACYQSGTFTE